MRTTISGYGFPLRMMGLVSALVLLAACSSPASPVPPTPAPTPTNTPLPPTATVALPEGGAEWDYVVLGASAVWGFFRKYAAHIEADLGVKVTVHDWTFPDQHSTALLRNLRHSKELRSDILEAEVVTFYIPPEYLRTSLHSYYDGSCGGEDNQDCLREGLTSYKADVDAILAEILSLTSTSDTLIRPMTFYDPFVNYHKKLGIFEDVTPYVKTANEYVVQIASEHNLPAAQVYLAFNGPNGDEDAADKGYMSDTMNTDSVSMHTNSVGAALIADLHRELGYEPLAP